MTSTTPSPVVLRPILSKPMEILLKVVMIAVGPLLLIGLLEGAAFLWERAQANGPYAWEMVASRRIDLEVDPEPAAGYTLMKPGSRYEWQGIPVTVNSHGLRGPEISYEKPPNTYRILNLGDSIAMGWGVREEETYGRRLEDMLNEGTLIQGTLIEGALDDRQYEVINAGVPGWNVENELAYLQAEGLKYEPDLIVLDLTIVNDILGGNATQANKRPAPIEWLRTNTHFWPFLTIQLRSLQARANGQERIDIIDPPTEASSYFPTDLSDPRWDRIWNWVSGINELAVENDIPLLLVMFPLEHQVLDEGFSTLAQELFAERAAESGIPVLDLLTVFRQACQDKSGGVCHLEDRYLFCDVWMHPSAYGHELTATELHALLSNFSS